MIAKVHETWLKESNSKESNRTRRELFTFRATVIFTTSFSYRKLNKATNIFPITANNPINVPV